MFRNVIRTREIRIGLIFFLLVAGGSLLYSWLNLRTSQEAFERRQKFHGLDTPKESQSAEKVNTPVSIEIRETADTETTGSEKEAATDVDLADARVRAETTTQDVEEQRPPDAATSFDGENEPSDVPSEKTVPAEEASEDLAMSPEELQERENAEAVIEQFLESRPDMQVPLEEILKNPAIASKIRNLNVQLKGAGRFYSHTPEDVRDAISTLNENQ